MTEENRDVRIWQSMTVIVVIMMIAGVFIANQRIFDVLGENSDLEWELLDAKWKIRSLKLKYHSLERDYEEVLLLQSKYFLEDHPNDIYIFSDSRKRLAGDETTYYATMVLYQSTNPSSVLHYAVENTKYIHGRTYIGWDGPGYLLNLQGESNLTLEGLEIGPVD